MFISYYNIIIRIDIVCLIFGGIMQRIIEIDLFLKSDLYEKYNKKNVSRDLIDYIVRTVMFFDKKDSIKIIFNDSLNEDVNYIELLKNTIRDEYNYSLRKNHYNNVMQIIYLLLGIIIIFVSTIVDSNLVFKELLLIGGWVLIWEMMELFMFTDLEEKRRRKILKRLLSCEIIERDV